MSHKACVLFLSMVVGLSSFTLASGAEDKKGDWGPLQFLVGDWVGEGGGSPGQGAGEFSFHPDLQGRILVRKNFADYPASKDRPAFRHDDLTIVYRESEGAPPRAIYFDNEGHVIRYSIAVSSETNTIEFVSDASPSAPRFRLTYSKTGGDTVGIKFEMAPPGKPDAFSTYIEAKAKRKQHDGVRP
jgi:hypothetical protein